MALREDLLFSGVATAVLTAGLVGGAGHLWGAGTGRVAAEVVAGAVAVAASAALSRALVARPMERELRRLAGALRDPAAVELDPELSPLVAAAAGLNREHAEALGRATVAAESAWEALDTSPFAIAILDREGRISWANQTFRTMLRLRGEPVGRRPIEVVSHAELHEVTEEALETGERAVRAFPTETQDLVARASPSRQGHVVLRVEDVTAQRQAERARTDFVANVSHELRTPVAAMLGYLEMVLTDRDRVPADLVPLIETADRNARRLRDLFEDLLRLHRIEVRRRELPLRDHRLLPILAEATGPARDKAGIRKQTFELDCPADLVACVNPEALSAMVGNLASNASAYTPEGGHVRVVARQEERGVRIDVIDDGIGIAERHHERIFERFYRVDDARSRRAGGTGLGLAIVKHYALASHCRVHLVSQEGKGSTFTLHLPV